MSNVNGVLLKHLLQMMEEDNQNYRLSKLLEGTVKDVEVKYNSISLLFSNTILVTISWNLDSFYLYISDISFYDKEDTYYRPMGIDRINWYLKQIANYKYDWMKK